MNHGIVLLVLLATFSRVDHHGCNGQQINASPPLPLPPPPSAPASAPALVQFTPPPLLAMQFISPPQPFELPRPPPFPYLSVSSDCPDLNCPEIKDNSKSESNIGTIAALVALVVVVIVGALAVFAAYNRKDSSAPSEFPKFNSFVSEIVSIISNISGLIPGLKNPQLKTPEHKISDPINIELRIPQPINLKLRDLRVPFPPQIKRCGTVPWNDGQKSSQHVVLYEDHIYDDEV
ncbi:hypothetical protein SUGI_0217150 [Cryptomeria japonica]|nr:hypothetical protein SUGI_0217150 [Cryptomeria japonica]